MPVSTDLVLASDVVSSSAVERTLQGLNARHGVQGNSFFSTIQGDDLETKLTVLDAMDNSEPLAQNLNKTHQVEHIIISTAEMVNEETGALGLVPRVVIIDADGKAFHAMSGPVLRSVENVFGIVGPQSSWGRPIPLKAVQEGSGNRKYLLLKVDLPALIAADKAAKGK